MFSFEIEKEGRNSVLNTLNDGKILNFDIVSSYVSNSNDLVSESHDSIGNYFESNESNNEIIKSSLFGITHVTGKEERKMRHQIVLFIVKIVI